MCQLVAEFSKLCKNMIVIEERRSFLEKNIRDGLYHTLSPEQAADIAGPAFRQDLPATACPAFPNARACILRCWRRFLIPLIKATEEIPAELRNGRLTAELDRIRKASKPKLQIFNAKGGLAHADVLPRLPAPRQLGGLA